MRTTITHHKNRGLSLVELLITIGVLSSLAAIGIYAMTGLNSSAKKQKLMADVATLNSALRVYEANGGSLNGVKEPMGAINRLKTVSSNWREIAGLRNSMVDTRLDVEWVTRGREIRAVWDEDKARFVIGDRGRGVSRFLLNDELSEAVAVEEERDVNLELAKKDTWVWDYQDRGIDKTRNLIRPGDGGRPDVSVPGNLPGAKRLSPPEISRPGGEYDLSEFDFDVFLRNPNSSTISVVMFSTDAGEWKEYAGEPIEVSIGSTVKAYVASTDPENWTDSRRVRHRYTFIPVVLDMALSFERSAYNYAELGGAMIPGVYSPVLAEPGEVFLRNTRSIPVKYLNEDTFGIFSQFGTNEATRVSLDAKHSGNIPLNVAMFGSDTSVRINADARSFIPELLNSAVQSVTLEVDPMPLRAPIILEQPRPDGLVIYGQHYLLMDLDSAVGDMPEGARIYYTADGSDPGYADGLPTSPVAALYEEPFLISQPQTVPVKARVYPPEGYEQWFTVSEVSQIAWPAPPKITFSTAITLP